MLKSNTKFNLVIEKGRFTDISVEEWDKEYTVVPMDMGGSVIEGSN